MFADTITFTDMFGTDDFVMTRVRQDGYSSEYRLVGTDFLMTMNIRNSEFINKKRNNVVQTRHNVELIRENNTTIAGELAPRYRKVYITFETDRTDSPDSMKQFVSGFTEFLSEANVVKLLGFES